MKNAIWKYKLPVASLLLIALLVGAVAYLSRQASNAEKQARPKKTNSALCF